jgi:hypothetical protein
MLQTARQTIPEDIFMVISMGPTAVKAHYNAGFCYVPVPAVGVNSHDVGLISFDEISYRLITNGIGWALLMIN